jgi:cytochrome P450
MMGSDHTDPHDWDPRSPDVLSDQIAAYDVMRRLCPVAHSESLHWSLFRHADVMRVLHDPDTFSNVVSTHRSVPNGMDPPEHTAYRRVIDPYFSVQRMAAFEPSCRAMARTLIDALPRGRETDLMGHLAHDFALKAQWAFLDWPAELHDPLREWTRRNQAATRSGDKAATAAVAFEFDRHIRELLASRRQNHAGRSHDDVATRLLLEQVQGRLLTDEEIVSILRNWTVGELATLSASVGILVHYLATHQALQRELRDHPVRLPVAIDEILRIHGPLIASRRRTTKPVEIGGRRLESGARLTLMWASANRDEDVVGDPDEFRLDRNPADNLLYGAGIHVCPGAPLARLELRVLMEELLQRSRALALASGAHLTRAIYPASGFSALPVVIT